MTFSPEIAKLPRAEKLIWVFFGVTCLQLAFLQPYLVLIPGERANLFSGVLCFLTLLVACFLGKESLPKKSPEFLISLVLLILALLSGLFSLNPCSAPIRVFILAASALGGFWCARLLLNTATNRRLFQWLCLIILTGIMLLSFMGYFFSGKITHFFDPNYHSPTDIIFLLSFAPLTLITEKSRPKVILGVVILGLSYLILCLSGSLSVVLISQGLFLAIALMGRLPFRYFLIVVITMSLLPIGRGTDRPAIFYVVQHIMGQKTVKEHVSVYYRIENIYLSWRIALEHPFFGIGLRTPRGKFLENYQPRYPYVTKEEFAQKVGEVVSSDNMVLTILAGLGFPFLIIYSTSILILLWRMIRMASGPSLLPPIPPLAILLPLLASLLHYQFFDGLLFPQLSWFFHILLGLIPTAAGKGANQAPAQDN
jgi:hypothetical protein